MSMPESVEFLRNSLQFQITHPIMVGVLNTGRIRETIIFHRTIKSTMKRKNRPNTLAQFVEFYRPDRPF